MRGWWRSGGRKNIASQAAAASSSSSQKITRHSLYSSTSAQIQGAMVVRPNRPTLNISMGAMRSSGSVVSCTRMRDAENSPPAPSPWMARPATSMSMLFDCAHTTQPTPNSTMPISENMR